MIRTGSEYIQEAIRILADSGLKQIDDTKSQEIFKGVMQSIGLESLEEVYLFVALFYRTSIGKSSNMDNISNYFKWSSLDATKYTSALKSLIDKELIVRRGRKVDNIDKQKFVVSGDIFSTIMENKLVTDYQAENDEGDKYDFCIIVSSAIEDTEMTIDDKIKFIEYQEDKNTYLPFIREIRKNVRDIFDRMIFYEICCNDFFNIDKKSRNSLYLDDVLSDINCDIKQFILTRKDLMSEEHILITLGLILLTDDEELILSNKGRDFFYAEDARAFYRSCKCKNIYVFMQKLNNFFHSNEYDSNSIQCSYVINKYLSIFENDNRHLPTVQHIASIIPNKYDRVLFYSISEHSLEDSQCVLSREIRMIYPTQDRVKIMNEFKEGVHFLQKQGLIETKTKKSKIGNYSILILTDKGKVELLGKDAKIYIRKEKNNLLTCDKIAEKQLFFSPQLENQLSLLRNSLSQEYYKGLCERLEKNNLPKGMAVLLYGKPGTGKTESVMQIAKATGRDIMHVDISATKSCWFGESEKLIKKVFTDYRRICEKSKVKPILLFNEADAIFSTRKDITGSDRGVGQTENAIQNIILEEMENLDGILIATTNLADNLDKAFERRFLFKIYFDLPTIEAKTNIWKDKLPTLSTEEATTLASTFEFSGGQIDNIVRKSLMQEVISGNKPTLNDLITMCRNEKISKTKIKKLGF